MKIGAFEVTEAITQLRDTVAVATLRPWIDAGNVGTLTLRRLQSALGAREGGQLARPGEFFDFTRYRPTVRYDGDERQFVVPNTRLSYARRPGGDVLFLDVIEPHARSEEYLDSIVEVLRAANVKAHWRIGAWFGAVPHTRPLHVSMSIGGKQVDARTRREVRRSTRYEGPTSIMSLLGEMLERRGVENNALMLQLPHYVQLDDDHTAAASMLEAAATVLDVEVDVAEAVTGMKVRGQRQYERIDRMVSGDPDLKQAVAGFEQAYDMEHGRPEPDGPALSPEIERFLGEVVRRIDEGTGEDA